MNVERLAEQKANLRQHALARRKAMPDSIRKHFSIRLLTEGLRLSSLLSPRVVSAFYPVRDEPDTLALLAGLVAGGIDTALPVTGRRSTPLTFRLWRPGDPTAPGPMNIPEPTPAAALVDPDLLFVPLAVFDRRGHRIGYGAGHYDRTLADLRARKPIRSVGVAYASSETERVPNAPHDERLDYILTESELIDIADAR